VKQGRRARETAARSLTRKLAQAAGDAVITMRDCGTLQGLPVRSVYGTEGDIDRPLSESLRGRVSRTTIRQPGSDAVIVHENEPVSQANARAIEALGLEPVRVRSPLTCQAPRGICQLCYGIDPTTGTLVEMGTAVGIRAAQALGEQGAHLVPKTFHIGSVCRSSSSSSHQARKSGIVRFERFSDVVNNQGKRIALSTLGQVSILQVGTEHQGEDARVLEWFAVPQGAELAVENGTRVRAGQLLFSWDAYHTRLFAEENGIVQFEGLIAGRTLVTEPDPITGQPRHRIVESTDSPPPQVRILDEGGLTRQYACIPTDSILEIRSGEAVVAGTCLARTPLPSPPIEDVVGGLPRVVEVLEMPSRDTVPLAEISGRVRIGVVEQGRRPIYIQPVDGPGLPTGAEVEHRLLPWQHLRVYQGEMVSKGTPLADGMVDPRDLLRLLGPLVARQNMARQLQRLYALQRIAIDDRHIEVIVASLVREESPGQFRLQGMTEAGRNGSSFLASLLAGDVRHRLTDAALRGSVDRLTGLTANVLSGRLIPAGTGFRSGP
jgi:DNA-directed RNA polymerase subunit beta'